MDKQNKKQSVRPWARFFARMIDHVLYVPVIVLVTFLPGGYLFEGILIYPLVFAVIVIIEALLLSHWGYTPGKYLFAVQVRKSDSNKLSFKEATQRTWGVLFEGLWLMIPIISIIGGINAWVQLTNDGVTSWDKKGGFVVGNSRK